MTNLDFAGNLGHSIVESKDDRIYIEKGNRRKLSEVKMFTFDLLEREVLYLALSSIVPTFSSPPNASCSSKK